MPIENWNGKQLESEVDKKTMRFLNALGIIGETATKKRITDLDRVDKGHMRAGITHEVNEQRLQVRWGGNTEYLPFQELGTLNEDGSQRIKPMFALRDSLFEVKRRAPKVKV